MNERAFVIALYAGSVCLLLATVAWPFIFTQDNSVRDRALAVSGLARIADSERAIFVAEGRYVPFGASVAERTAALPRLHLGPEFDDLSFDTVLDRDGALKIRVISRVDAIRAGRVSALMESAELASRSKELPNKGQ